MRKLKKFDVGGATSDPTKIGMQTSSTLGDNPDDMFGKGIKGAITVNKFIDSAIPGIAEYQAGTGNRTGYQKGLAGAKMGFDIATGVIGSLGPAGAGAAAILKGADWLTGKLGKKAERINVSETLGSSSGYGGLTSSIGTQQGDIESQRKAGGITKGLARLFGGKSPQQMNRETQELKRKQMETANVLKESKKKLAGVGTESQYRTAQNQLQLSGMTGGDMAVGKQGMKLPEKIGMDKESLRRVIALRKNGGKMNIIVDGNLHSEKHDLKNSIDTEITNKGVPVVAMQEGGEIVEQTAEVEKNELILHLELTKQLEDLAKDPTEENMINAGKILSKEIIKNTKDSKDRILKNG